VTPGRLAVRKRKLRWVVTGLVVCNKPGGRGNAMRPSHYPLALRALALSGWSLFLVVCAVVLVVLIVTTCPLCQDYSR
jgi:hypothetical protein